jgi:hypothetical protein
MSLGCKYEGNIWLSWKFLQQLAGTGFHGGRSRLDSIFQELLHAAALGSVVSRKVREPLKSEGFYYRAAIVQVVVQSCHGALAFGSREAKSRNHGRKMPAQFDLIGLGEETEEFWFVAIEEARFLGGDFFGGIGGAQAHDGFSSQRHLMSSRNRCGSLMMSRTTLSAGPIERRSEPSSMEAIF